MISNDILAKVNEVNDRIKKHNKEVEEKKALRKIRLEQLRDKCNEYKKDFGVDLYNENLSEMQENVSKLLEKEEKLVKESLEKAEKLLSLVDSGKFDELNKELGITSEDTLSEDGKEIEEKPEKKVKEKSKSATKKETSSDNILDLIDEMEEDPKKPNTDSKELKQDTKDELEDIGLDDLFNL